MYGLRWEEALSTLQDRLEYRFNDLELLREALTHSSYAHELGLRCWNERLEFLGDAVLELAASTRIYGTMEDLNEGGLTKLRSKLVCGEALLAWARVLDLQEVLRVNRGLRKNGDDASSSMHADAVEAIFGAVYLDGGYDVAESVVNRYLDFQLEREDYIDGGISPVDPKSKLQQILQEKGEPLPEYRLVSRDGPPHSPTFEVELYISGELSGRGRGKSIKEAEIRAAQRALSVVQSVAKDEPR